MPGEEQKTAEQIANEQKEKDATVSIKTEEYTKMVTKMGEMQTTIEKLMERDSQKEQINQEREQEAQRIKQEGQQPTDLNELDNNALAQFIVGHITKNVSDPLLQMIATSAVRQERQELEAFIVKEGEDPAFYEKEVLDLVMKKPALSLKEAYKLIKVDKGSSKKSDDKEKDKEKTKQPLEFAGERPGGTKTQFAPTGKMTLDEAAAKAMEGYQEHKK